MRKSYNFVIKQKKVMVIKCNEVTNFYHINSQVTLILRLRSVTNLTLARANQFNNKLWNTCGNGVQMMLYFSSFRINKILPVLQILLFLNLNCIGQTFIIYKNDTNLLKRYTSISNVNLRFNYRDLPYVDFKEKLPNGIYFIMDCEKKDSNRMFFNKIKMKGVFLDSLRDGQFDYYVKSNNKNGNFLSITYNYKRGKLNGYYNSFIQKIKKDEGYFIDGKRDGFFVSFNYDATVKSVELFKKDSLTDFVKYEITARGFQYVF